MEKISSYNKSTVFDVYYIICSNWNQHHLLSNQKHIEEWNNTWNINIIEKKNINSFKITNLFEKKLPYIMTLITFGEHITLHIWDKKNGFFTFYLHSNEVGFMQGNIFFHCSSKNLETICKNVFFFKNIFQLFLNYLTRDWQIADWSLFEALIQKLSFFHKFLFRFFS
jgi:hypothetical protein